MCAAAWYSHHHCHHHHQHRQHHHHHHYCHYHHWLFCHHRVVVVEISNDILWLCCCCVPGLASGGEHSGHLFRWDDRDQHSQELHSRHWKGGAAYYFFLMVAKCPSKKQNVSQGRICEDKLISWHTEIDLSCLVDMCFCSGGNLIHVTHWKLSW